MARIKFVHNMNVKLTTYYSSNSNDMTFEMSEAALINGNLNSTEGEVIGYDHPSNPDFFKNNRFGWMRRYYFEHYEQKPLGMTVYRPS